MSRLMRSRWFWFVAALAAVALAAWSLQGEVRLRRGPHGLEAVQVYDEEFTLTDRVDDGPYVRYVEGGVEARWVCAGEVQVQRQRVQAWPVRLAPRCGQREALWLRPPAEPDTQARVAAPVRLAALSDVHGQYALMMQLLRAHGIVDSRGDWAFGDGQLVMTGDVFDRGPEVTETFWRLYALESQAREAGGAVHFLLGNHEALVLREDLRYLNGKYRRTARLLETPYAALYGPDTVLGDWLRSKRTLLQVDGVLFMHAGVHPSFLALGLSLEQANERFRGSLGLDKAALARDPVLSALHGSEGPIWYRGYFLDEGLRQAQVEAALARLGAERIAVGHTSQPVVHSLFGGRVIAIDSSIKKGRYGELLLREGGDYFRGTPDGRRLPLGPLPAGD